MTIETEVINMKERCTRAIPITETQLKPCINSQPLITSNFGSPLSILPGKSPTSPLAVSLSCATCPDSCKLTPANAHTYSWCQEGAFVIRHGKCGVQYL